MMDRLKYKLEGWYYSIKYFFINTWKFKKELAGYRSWDSECNLALYIATIKDLRYTMEKYSNEVKKDLNPKLVDMDRLIELFDNLQEDNYAERCGYDYNYGTFFKPIATNEKLMEMITDESKEQVIKNSKALEDGMKLEQKEWKEMLKLIGKSKTWWY